MRKMHNYVLMILVITLLWEDFFEAQRQMGCYSYEYGLWGLSRVAGVMRLGEYVARVVRHKKN